MKLASIILLLFVSAVTALADCPPMRIDRNSTVPGRIDESCSARLFTFRAENGDVIAATVQGANPSIEVLGGDSDASVPRVTAPDVVTVRWSASSGDWTIRVTGDPGEFILTTRRKPASSIRPDRHCIYELMMCNEIASWELTSEHCTYNEGGYSASFRMWGAAGDRVSLDAFSTSFTPRIILREKISFAKLLTADRHLNFIFPSSQVYDIDVTSVEPNATGPFELRVSCASSGCSAPAILGIDGAGRVPYQHATTLSASTIGFPSPAFEWYEATALPEYLKTAPVFTTPRVEQPQSYVVRAVNPCGQDDSELIRVVPDVRRRVAR